MVRLFQNFDDELLEAQRQEAEQLRAESTAASFTPSMLENLDRFVESDPNLPADAVLSLSLDPNGPSLFENLSLANAQSRAPQVGDTVRASQIRNMTDEQWAEAEAATLTVLNRLQNGPRSRAGRIASGLGGAAMTVGDFAARGTESFVGEVGYGALKGFTRNAMPVLDAGQQLVQASGRHTAAGVDDLFRGNVGGAASNFAQASVNPLSLPGLVDQTDLGQLAEDRGNQIGQALTGQEVTAGQDYGDGFFISEDSQVVQRRKEAERRMGVLPNGQTYTIGRTGATWAGLDPEGTSYNVMSGVLDGIVAVAAPGPEGAMASKLGDARAPIARLFGGVSEREYMSAIGTSRGLRTQFNPERARDFLQGDASRNLVETLAGENTWTRVDRLTGQKLDTFTVTSLADARDADDVREILLAAAETGQRPTLRSLGGRRVDAVARSIGEYTPGIRRLGGQVPPNTIDLQDGRQAVDAIESFGRNIKADENTIEEWVSLMGRANDQVSRREAYAAVLSESTDVLSARRFGVSPERARSLTRYMVNELSTDRALFEDMLRADTGQWSQALITHLGEDGAVDLMQGVSVLAETAKQLPLPNARDLSRAVGWSGRIWEAAADPENASVFARVLGTGWEGAVSTLSFMQSRLWKDMRLMRLGYPLRVLPEEQLRRVADGQTLLSDPMSVFGRLLDPRVADGDIDGLYGGVMERFGRLFDDTDSLPPAQAGDLVRLDAERGGIRQLTGEAASDNAFFEAALADERLAGLRTSEVPQSNGALTRFMKRQPGTGEINDEFVAVWKDQLITMGSDPVMTRLARKGVDETLADLGGSDTGRAIRQRLIAMEPSLADDLTLRNYLVSMSARLDSLTGGSDELLQVVRRGEWPKDLKGDRLRTLADVAGPDAVAGRGVIRGQDAGIYDRFFGPIFNNLAAKPTNKLSRSPVWLEQYERNIIEMARLARDPDELFAAAQRANVRESTMEVLRRTAKGEGELTVDQINQIASYGAMQHVKGLLYDTTRSSQFFDQFRLMMPFGEAWREVVTTWAKLITNDPFTVTRRAGQAGRALTSNDTGQTYFDMVGLDREADTGFFYENQFGDSVFYYPLSQEIMGAATDWGLEGGGMPWRLEGGARNLNLAGEILPGVGPVSGVAVEWLLPDDTQWDGLREQIFPFGPPPDLDSFNTWLPAWLGTMRKGDGLTSAEQSSYANTKFSVARSLYSQNPDRYQGSGGAQLLDDDASPIASRAFLVRGIAQLISPASPMPTPVNLGPNDELVDQWVMANKYQEFLEQDPATALDKFLELYGQGNLLVTQGNTVTTVYGGAPLEGAGYDWVRENDSIVNDHPEIYGFFAPLGDGSDFSSEAYRRSLDNGERVRLTFAEKVALAEHRQASAIYRTYTDVIEGEPNDVQRAQLGEVRRQLRDVFPGYQRVDGIGQRDEVWRIIEGGDVDRALADQALASTPAGDALATYWEYRAQIVEAATAEGLDNANGGGWRTSNSGLGYRDALRQAGESIKVQEPEFARIWDLFLIREFKDDEIEEVEE